MIEFKYGDRVVITDDSDLDDFDTENEQILEYLHNGVTGTVVCLNHWTNLVGVAFDLSAPNHRFFHSCDGECDDGFGRFVKPNCLSLISDDIPDEFFENLESELESILDMKSE